MKFESSKIRVGSSMATTRLEEVCKCICVCLFVQRSSGKNGWVDPAKASRYSSWAFRNPNESTLFIGRNQIRAAPSLFFRQKNPLTIFTHFIHSFLPSFSPSILQLDDDRGHIHFLCHLRRRRRRVSNPHCKHPLTPRTQNSSSLTSSQHLKGRKQEAKDDNTTFIYNLSILRINRLVPSYSPRFVLFPYTRSIPRFSRESIALW